MELWLQLTHQTFWFPLFSLCWPQFLLCVAEAVRVTGSLPHSATFPRPELSSLPGQGLRVWWPRLNPTSYLAFLHAGHMAPTSRHCCTQNSGMVVGVSFGDRKLGRFHFQLVLQKRDQTKVMGGIFLLGQCLGKVRNMSSNHLWAPRSLPSASCHCKILFKKQMDGILPKTTSYCFFSHLYFQITEYYLTFLDLTTFFCMCISCFQYGQSYCNTDEEPQALVGQ